MSKKNRSRNKTQDDLIATTVKMTTRMNQAPNPNSGRVRELSIKHTGSWICIRGQSFRARKVDHRVCRRRMGRLSLWTKLRSVDSVNKEWIGFTVFPLMNSLILEKFGRLRRRNQKNDQKIFSVTTPRTLTSYMEIKKISRFARAGFETAIFKDWVITSCGRK